MTTPGQAGDSSIHVLLVDDEPPSRMLLRSLLESLHNVSVVAECGDGQTALRAIERYTPNVVLLDINMPRMSGIEMLSQYQGSLPYTIIVTALRDHAVQAFDLEVTDYLLKPVSARRLERALERARRAIERQRLSSLAESIIDLTRFDAAQVSQTRNAADARHGQRLLLRKGNEIKSIAIREIVRLESANQYVKIHTTSDTFVRSGSLRRFAEQFDSSTFIQISRSDVVNIRYVESVRKSRNGVHILDLHDGERLRVARSRATAALQIAESLG